MGIRTKKRQAGGSSGRRGFTCYPACRCEHVVGVAASGWHVCDRKRGGCSENGDHRAPGSDLNRSRTLSERMGRREDRLPCLDISAGCTVPSCRGAHRSAAAAARQLWSNKRRQESDFSQTPQPLAPLRRALAMPCLLQSQPSQTRVTLRTQALVRKGARQPLCQQHPTLFPSTVAACPLSLTNHSPLCSQAAPAAVSRCGQPLPPPRSAGRAVTTICAGFFARGANNSTGASSTQQTLVSDGAIKSLSPEARRIFREVWLAPDAPAPHLIW